MSRLRFAAAVAMWLFSVGAASDDVSAAEQRTERGPVNALVRLAPDTVRTGDPVTLTIKVTAEAGVELLMPVFGSSLERFTILEFVPREAVDDAGRTVSTQHYRLQAPASGEHTIPPITIEFVDRRAGQREAPEDEDAYELLTERIMFNVESVVPEGAGSDLKPPLGPLAALDLGGTSSWPWAAVGIALVIAGVLILVGRRLYGRDVPKSAYAIALARLETLEVRERPDAEAMDAFFVELSDLVRRYLEDRFALHAPELTTEEFLDVAAGSPDLTRNHRSVLRTFLESADQVKFARFVPTAADVDIALSAVRGFLEQTADDEPQVDGSPSLVSETAHG